VAFSNFDWVFSYAEDFFFYSYKLVSFNLSNFVVNDNNYLLNKTYMSNYNLYSYDLFLSVIITQFYYLSVYTTPYFNDFFKHILNSVEYTDFFVIHPEIYFIFKDYSNQYGVFFTDLLVSLHTNFITETFIHPLFVLVEIISFFMLLSYFLIMYFSYYNNSTTEENLIDHDYLVGTVTVESEEEIGSIDDTLLSMVIFTLLFLWFFWINGFFFFFSFSIYTSVISLFPFLYMLIIIIPTLLLVDYGIYFLTYLSGSGKSTSITVEFTFDYIAMSIFFLRLLVQNVRLIFMIFTFTELHEMIIYDRVVVNFCFFDELILANKGNYWNIFKNGHYYLFKLSMVLLNWLYELFHTFFMVIFQFIAFFAMIFWLFLFLYSMFSVEMHEAYFYIKRKILERKRRPSYRRKKRSFFDL